MLTYHLQNALSDLRELIKIIELDIDDIKQARHDSQFDRLSKKEEKIKEFEAKKALIDRTISMLMTSNPNSDLASLLNDEQHKLLDEFKVELLNLQTINKKYAKLVVVVSNVYDQFLEKLVPTEMQGYKKVASKTSSSLLEIRV